MKYILVYVRHKFYKTILWLIYFSILYYFTYHTYPDLLFLSLHYHTTPHTRRFQIEFNFTKLYSDLFFLPYHTALYTVPLPIAYFSLFIAILLCIHTTSKSNSIFQNYSLNYISFCYILIYIQYLFRSLISLSSSLW